MAKAIHVKWREGNKSKGQSDDLILGICGIGLVLTMLAGVVGFIVETLWGPLP
jgi:hypothetical protein